MRRLRQTKVGKGRQEISSPEIKFHLRLISNHKRSVEDVKPPNVCGGLPYQISNGMLKHVGKSDLSLRILWLPLTKSRFKSLVYESGRLSHGSCSLSAQWMRSGSELSYEKKCETFTSTGSQRMACLVWLQAHYGMQFLGDHPVPSQLRALYSSSPC